MGVAKEEPWVSTLRQVYVCELIVDRIQVWLAPPSPVI